MYVEPGPSLPAPALVSLILPHTPHSAMHTYLHTVDRYEIERGREMACKYSPHRISRLLLEYLGVLDLIILFVLNEFRTKYTGSMLLCQEFIQAWSLGGYDITVLKCIDTTYI
jgi:hypothetical protein